MASKKEELAAGRRLHYIREPVSFLVARSSCLAGSGSVWGYVREGHYYRAEKANEDTLVFFCHFGVSCVLISYLLSISPLVMLQNFCAAPSSVSTIVTEERRKGIASFRMSSFGDISHLYAHQEPPSFAARFCETYDNKEQRHD